MLIGLFLALATSSGAAAETTNQITIQDAQVTLIAEVRAPAREAGVLTDFSVKEGDLVEAGDVLGRLDSDLAAIDEEVSRIEVAIAKLQSENDVDRRYAEKSLEVARAELRRSLESVKAVPKSISKTELERLQLVVDKTSLSIEQSDRDLRVSALTKQLKEQSVRTAMKHLELRKIVAPISGIVVQVFRQEGEWLDVGEPVVRLVKMDRLRVEAFVDGAKFGANLQGCPVRLAAHLPPGDRLALFDGHVVFVSPELQPVNGQIRVWAEVDNPQLELRPGMRGTLTITAAR